MQDSSPKPPGSPSCFVYNGRDQARGPSVVTRARSVSLHNQAWLSRISVPLEVLSSCNLLPYLDSFICTVAISRHARAMLLFRCHDELTVHFSQVCSICTCNPREPSGPVSIHFDFTRHKNPIRHDVNSNHDSQQNVPSWPWAMLSPPSS